MTIFERVDLLEATVEAQGATILSMEQTLDEILHAEEDTGWITLPLATGIIPYSDALAPKVRRIGNIVFMDGVVKNILNPNIIVAKLPEGFRPTRQAYFVGGSATISNKATFYNCQINSNGDVRITTQSTGTYNTDYYLRLSCAFSIN